jgi:glyoxylase-like metal-dependent hydrolase (beta-lactamase superfamily II)
MEPDRDISTIKLGNEAFEGQNNAYLLHTEDITLIDTGLRSQKVEQKLRSQLERFGYSFSDIDTIVLTHWHTDHSGLAGAIQAEGSADVYIHTYDLSLVTQERETLQDFSDMQNRYHEEWAIPSKKLEEVPYDMESPELAMISDLNSATSVTDGDVISLGDEELHVKHTPGHTLGQCCFEFTTSTGIEAFVGDTVLPVYSPNVGGADVRVDQSLQQTSNSLKSILNQEYDRLWPGHRSVITDPANRINEILDHHVDRASRILSILRERGPCTPWEISAELFGELEGIHIIHGPGEAYAHLEHLRKHQFVKRTGQNYQVKKRDSSDIRSTIIN